MQGANESEARGQSVKKGSRGAPGVQTSHVTPVVAGGASTPQPPRPAEPAPPRKPRRSNKLRLIDPRIDIERSEPPLTTWEPVPGVPAGGRAECVDGDRPCRYVRCRFHLWRDDDPEGRPWHGKQPTLIPAWLEYPTPMCCALDVADAVRAGQLKPSDVPALMHLSRSRMWVIIKGALEKLRAAGANIEELRI
jgi:hypothetical protein